MILEYRFTGLNSQGRVVQGTFSVPSAREARHYLTRLGRQQKQKICALRFSGDIEPTPDSYEVLNKGKTLIKAIDSVRKVTWPAIASCRTGQESESTLTSVEQITAYYEAENTLNIDFRIKFILARFILFLSLMLQLPFLIANEITILGSPSGL